MSNAKSVSVTGTIIYNTGEVGTITSFKISQNGQWTQEPPKEVRRGTPVTFSATGTVEGGAEVKGSIELGGITLEFALDGDKNAASFKQMMGPTITATVTAGATSILKYDLER